MSEAGGSSITTTTKTAQPEKSAQPFSLRMRQQLARRYASLRAKADPITRHISLSLITAEGLDKFSRIIFPLAFLLFNISFWIVYSQPVVFFSHLFEEN